MAASSLIGTFARTLATRWLPAQSPSSVQAADCSTDSAASTLSGGRCLYLDHDSRIISESYSHNHDGSLAVGFAPSQQTTGAVQYGTIDLPDEEAKAFQAELKVLVEYYTRQKTQNPIASTSEYSFVVAITRT